MNPTVQALLWKIKDPIERLDAMEKYEERCAICEFDGKMSRMEAEQIALGELKAKAERNECGPAPNICPVRE